MKKILKFWTEKKLYFITAIIALLILALFYTIKNVFPFGVSNVIFSGIQEEMSAYYYHLWDSIRGTKSLLIDWSSGGGVNFWATIGYYLSSPISLVILLIPRSFIVHFTPIITAIKIILASITCLYMINKCFKKLPNFYKGALSILYAFLACLLSLYLNTSWLDFIYLLPLLIASLIRLVNLETSKMYTIVLSISLIISLYLSSVFLIYVFIATLIYISFYKNKKQRKQIIKNLFWGTFLSLLLASVILIPTYIQILSSNNNKSLLSTSMGLYKDRIIILYNLGPMLGIYFLYMFDKSIKNKDKKFVTSLLCLFILPIIIQPLNKILSFGLHIEQPLHYGIFILIVLIMISGVYLNGNSNDNESNKKKIIIAFLTLFGGIVNILITKIFYNDIVSAIINGNFTDNSRALMATFMISVFTILLIGIIFLINKKNKDSVSAFLIIAFTSLFTMLSVYIGSNNEVLENDYKNMISLLSSKKENDNYYLKNSISSRLLSNSGMVSSYNTFSSYNALTNNKIKDNMRKLGYDASLNNDFTTASNLFIDTILAQKYFVTDKKTNSNNKYYKYVGKASDLYLYEMRNSIGYGYLLDEIPKIDQAKNSFELSNIIYKSITGDDDLFEYNNTFKPENILVKATSDKKMSLKKEDNNAYLEKNVLVMDNKAVYLEIDFGDYLNKEEFFDAFEVRVMGKEIDANFTFPNNNHNGVIYLGAYKNELIQVRVNLLKDIVIDNINMAYLDLEKYDNFIKNYKVNSEITFDRNKINIEIDADEEKILFLPINYVDGYRLINNGVKGDVLKVYDNFIGIQLKKGQNKIAISYVPKGIIIGMAMSSFGLILFVLSHKRQKS